MIRIRIFCLILGYVFGLFQTGVIYGKYTNYDLRKHGSGNAGMTNAIRTRGWKAGIIVFIGDNLKAVLAIVIVWLLFREKYPDMVKLFEFYAAVGVVLGHDYPFYLKFKGGKGIACTVGIVCSTFAFMVPISGILFFVAVIPTGYISIGSLMIVASYFVQILVFGQLGFLGVAESVLPELYILAAFFTFLAFFKHRGNIKRLATGTENKFAPRHEDKGKTDKEEKKSGE